MTEPQHWRDAINLVHAESNRAPDERTRQHWKDVAALLEGDLLAVKVTKTVNWRESVQPSPDSFPTMEVKATIALCDCRERTERAEADLRDAREEALDEAAAIAHNWSIDAQSDCQDIADAIIALKEKP